MSDPCRSSSFSHAPFTFSSEDRLFVKSQRPNPHSGVVVATAFAEPTDVSLPDMNNSPIPCVRFLRTRRCSPIAAVFLLFLGMLAQSAIAQATLLGTVTNAATGRTLEGARVTIKGSQIEVTADSQGVYRFDKVTTGNVLLAVSYTGLKTVEVAVAVAPGGVTRQDVGLTADIYRMDKFVISGEREGSAQAVTLQRLSTGVKNVISTDAYGSLAGNPADLIGRIPGVNTLDFGGDTRYVQIRGLNQELTTVTMDGNRLADGAFGTTSRAFTFQAIGADAFERMEVTKSPTPDMDGDSIGGAVNMVSKSAFDSSPERRIRGSFGATWRAFDDRETRAPRNYSIGYSEVFAGKFGVSLNTAYRSHDQLQDGVTQLIGALPAGSPGPAYTYSFNYRDLRIERIRSTVALKLDYKLSNNTRFFINAQYNKAIEHETTLNATWSTNQVVATAGPNGALTGTGGIVPGFTDTLTVIRPVAATSVEFWPGLLYLDSKTANLGVGGVHRYDTWDINYDIYRSAAKSYYPGDRTMRYRASSIGFSIARGLDQIDRYYPTIAQTAGPDLTQLSNLQHGSYTHSPRVGWDQYLGASLNVTKKFKIPVPVSLKAGLRSREQDRKRENKTWSTVYLGPDRVAGLNPATGVNDDNLAQFGQLTPLRGGKLEKYPNFPFAAQPGHGNEIVLKTREAHPEWFQDNVAVNTSTPLINDQSFNERITAAYAQGSFDLGKLSVTGGVRVETTRVQAEGARQRIAPEEAARRLAWVGAVTDAETRRRTLAEYSGRQEVEGEYRNVFPGLHFKFTPVKGLVTRLSYSTNIGRPAIGTIIPSTTVNDTSQTISISNPKLKPQTADNFDLAAEYYFEPAGLISASVFLKEMKNFIFTQGGVVVGTGADNGFGGDYSGYMKTTQYNGGSSKVKGFELNYTQQFTFLPGFWSGFGAYANYTRLTAEGYYGTGGAIDLTSNNTLASAPTRELAGFVPQNANAGLAYIRNGITVRINFAYAGRYLQTFNGSQSRLIYQRPSKRVDVRTVYRLTRNFDVYFDVNNVFNQPSYAREYHGGQPQAQTLLSPQVLFGINGRL